MMDGRSADTKALIFEGLKARNIRNPFVYGMIDKNEFSFNKPDYKPSYNNGLLASPMGISFFLTPMVNAITRSGTIEEKKLVFDSLIKFKAFNYVPSIKRGHKPGETEQLVTQAIRVATNVKRHQDETVTKGMEKLEKKIAEEGLLEHKVLLILLEPGEVEPGLAGLVANKLMAKYQKCCAVLAKGIENTFEVYRGSMRAYSASGLDNFREICEASRGCLWSQGHASAAGLCINASQVQEFLEDTDKALADLPDETCYHVDYIWDNATIDGSRILDIANMNDYIMTNMPRSYVFIKNINITENNTMWMKQKHLKVKTSSGIDLIIWDCIDQEEEIMNKTINVVAKCNANSWNGNLSPQLICEEWEVVDTIPIVTDWGF